MSRILLAVLLLVFASECDTSSTPTPKEAAPPSMQYTVRTIDGCEYIQIEQMIGFNSGIYSLTHKGDCKNPIHSCASHVAEPKEKR